MANEQKLIMLDKEQQQYNQQETTKGNRKLRYILFAFLIFIADFVYDVSPIDLMPLLPFDDMAVSGGGFIAILSLIVKYYRKGKKKG